MQVILALVTRLEPIQLPIILFFCFQCFNPLFHIIYFLIIPVNMVIVPQICKNCCAAHTVIYVLKRNRSFWSVASCCSWYNKMFWCSRECITNRFMCVTIERTTLSYSFMRVIWSLTMQCQVSLYILWAYLASTTNCNLICEFLVIWHSVGDITNVEGYLVHFVAILDY